MFEPHTIKMTVTPEMAEKWLSQNTHNRNIRRRQVDIYAADMRNGRWRFTGDGIKFAYNEVLLDGQHRLLAIVDADVPVEMTVTYNLDNDAQFVMDNGVKRTTGDALGLEGVPNAALVAAITRALFSVWNKRDPSKLEQRELYLDYHDLIDGAIHFINMAVTENLRGGSMFGVAWVLFALIDEESATRFMTELITGIQLAEDNPIRLLRRELGNPTRRRPAGGIYGIRSALRPFVLTWNAWCVGHKTVPGLKTSSADLPALKWPKRSKGNQ